MQKKEKKHKYRSDYRLCKYTLITFALVATGCAHQTSAPIRIKLMDSYLHAEQSQDIGKAELMRLVKDVLAEMYFTIEKADLQAGLIRTRPLPGAQFFEFWRSDNVGPGNAFAANLHTIRRTATLYLTRQGMELSIRCEVHAQRLSLPERQVSSSARIYGMFSRSSRSLQRLQLNPEQAEKMAWIDLGRDSQLEAEIIKRIETQIIQRTNYRSRTTENKT